ncbi:MAG: tyrosine--tRNA ligase [Firmicutes bacterium]|nr:tyrosine--tRNA ligase [Bacillota bacterium]
MESDKIREVFEIFRRETAAIYSEDALKERLFSGKRLRVKFGADPSRPNLTIGHSVPLRKMKLLQDLGHEIVFLIGDYTGMVGDPTGRSKTRSPLTFEQTRANAESYLKQVSKMLDVEKTTIVFNSEWLSKLTFAETLTLTAKYTLAQVLERDDFAKRYAEKAPIGLHELLYPLMQGYDSVALRADIEIGGTDQTFNMLVGRELQRDYGQPQQVVIAFPLLPGLDGAEKMGKSLDNYIGVDEPPEIMFEKAMKVPDPLMGDYFRLTTDVPEAEFSALMAKDIREAHFAYAAEITALYHGREAVEAARNRYLEVAGRRLPERMDRVEMPAGDIGIVDLVAAIGFASSKGDARRLIAGGGVKLDNEPETDIGRVVAGTGEVVVSRGKNRFVKVVFTGK